MIPSPILGAGNQPHSLVLPFQLILNTFQSMVQRHTTYWRGQPLGETSNGVCPLGDAADHTEYF